MEKSLISRVIRAAKAGKLTEKQYEIYLQLLEEDPDFEQQVKWEQFLNKYLPASIDSELYEAATSIKLPEKQPVLKQFNYAIAAGIALVLISGWLVYEFLYKTNEPRLASTAPVEYFSGDSISTGQLGYAEGDLGVGEKTWKIWENERQKEQVSYQFCKDTLQLYFREIKDTTGFKTDYRLTYFADQKSYHLISKSGLLLKLKVCTDKPQPLIK